jgi:hypothetical protein
MCFFTLYSTYMFLPMWSIVYHGVHAWYILYSILLYCYFTFYYYLWRHELNIFLIPKSWMRNTFHSLTPSTTVYGCMNEIPSVTLHNLLASQYTVLPVKHTSRFFCFSKIIEGLYTATAIKKQYINSKTKQFWATFQIVSTLGCMSTFKTALIFPSPISFEILFL